MKVCFVGAGSIGKRHIYNWTQICKKKNISCDIHLLRSSKQKLEDDIEKLIKKQFFDQREMDVDYDVIFITNPTFLHYNTIENLKDKAKNFFVEKPVFVDLSKDISDLNLPKDNIYYVACPLRYTQALGYAKKIINAEDVISARAISSSYLPEWRNNVDYRTTYSAHKKQGGGVRIDLIHEWDYLIELFGFPQITYCLYGKYSDLEIDSEDLSVYIASYQDKIVELHLDYFGRQSIRKLELRTMKALYEIDINNSIIKINGEKHIAFDECVNDKYMREMEYFWNIAFSGFQNTNTLEHAVEVMEVALNV